jgi:hypothetical protein
MLKTLKRLLSSEKPDFDKAERNDPCPCGSGRKFKACHAHSVQTKKREEYHAQQFKNPRGRSDDRPDQRRRTTSRRDAFSQVRVKSPLRAEAETEVETEAEAGATGRSQERETTCRSRTVTPSRWWTRRSLSRTG